MFNTARLITSACLIGCALGLSACSGDPLFLPSSSSPDMASRGSLDMTADVGPSDDMSEDMRPEVTVTLTGELRDAEGNPSLIVPEGARMALVWDRAEVELQDVDFHIERGEQTTYSLNVYGIPPKETLRASERLNDESYSGRYEALVILYVDRNEDGRWSFFEDDLIAFSELTTLVYTFEDNIYQQRDGYTMLELDPKSCEQGEGFVSYNSWPLPDLKQPIHLAPAASPEDFPDLQLRCSF